MNAIMNEKGRQTKLLAAIAIIAMVVCAFAVILPAEKVSAEDATDASTGAAELDPEIHSASLTIGSTTTYYETLVAAWDEAVNQTEPAIITLLKDETGAGLKTISDKGANVTLDLNKHTYTATTDPAGSSGTENQGMQLLKGNTFLIMNGTFKTVTGEDGLMKNGINVYCDTEFKDVVMDFSESNGDKSGYNGLQLANGEVSLTGSTSIIERAEDYAIAFFANWKSYTGGSQVTINTTGTIDGVIAIAEYEPDENCGKSSLTIEKMGTTANTYIEYATNYAFDLNIADGVSVDVDVPAGSTVTGNIAFGDNEVSIKNVTAGNGGLKLSAGSVEISGIMTATEAQTEIEAASGDEVVLKNLTITSGTLNISGDVSVEGNVIVSEKATIAIGTNSSLNVAENAVLSVSGKVTTVDRDNTSVLNNEGTVAITNTKAEVPSVIGGSGNVDSSAVASEGTLSGSYDTTTTFTQNQVITVVSDTILVEGTQFVFEGKLIIPEGVTLTIEAGAQLVVNSSTGIIENNGTIVIESDAAMKNTGKYIEAIGGFAAIGTSKIINNGTIELAYYADVDGTAATNGQFNIAATATVDNNGTITVGEESKFVSSGKLTNAAGATINMNGDFKGKIMNAGTVVIDGTMSQDSSENTIVMTAAGASVQIDSLTGHLAINDTGISEKNIIVTAGDDKTNLTRAANYLRIQATADNVVSGLTITSEIVTEVNENDEKNPYYKNNLVIGGSVSADLGIDAAEDATASAALTTNGPRFVVSEELILDAGITYDVKGTLNVAGTVNVDEDAKLMSSESGTVKVTSGTVAIETNAIKTPLNVEASYYKVAKTTTTPLMHYYTTLANALASGATPITVYGPLTIDEALTINDGITVNAQSTVEIEEEGSLTINDGGRLNAGTDTVTVDGSLYAANEKTGLRGTTNIKSDVVSRGESDVLYTNLYSALNAAEAGDTVTLSQSKTTDRDITVKEGVVLKTGANTLTLGNDTVATVNGTIYINGGVLAVEASQAENEKAGSVTLNGLIQSDMPMDYGGAYPAGAYYSITSSGKVLYYIAPVEDAAAIISTVDQSTITINGDITIGDVSFTGTADEGAIVIIEDEVTAGTVTLDLAEVQVVGKFAGTVTDGTGTVAINVSGSETAAIASEMVDDAKAFVVSGTFGNTVMEDTKYAFTVTGTVDVDGASIPGVTVEGTMDIVSNSSITGAFVIKGTVNVDAGVTLTANSDITTIAGTLNAIVDDDGTKATVTLGTVYVGLEVVDGKIATATAGEITGTVTYTTLYVSADSTVPAALTDNKTFTGFYVEDALWLTAYGTTAVVPNAPVENADFQGWDDPETETEEKYDGKNITISAQERLDAVINYNVYNVTINTDGGIGSVAIDGNILSGIGNSFSVDGLTAGEHKVTYTLKNGFEGEATLSSSTVAVNGLTFTLSGDFENNDGPIEYVLNLSGTTPADTTVVIEGGNGGNGELGLTDYLLIVLVILIVVMAIIVAMRLMRS